MRAEEGQQKRARSIDSNSLIVPPGAHSLPCPNTKVCSLLPLLLCTIYPISYGAGSSPHYRHYSMMMFLHPTFTAFFCFSHCFLLFFFSSSVFEKYSTVFFFFFLDILKALPIFYAFNYSSIQSTDNQGLLPVSSILYNNSSLFPAVLQLD